MQLEYSELKLHANVLHSLTGLRPAEFDALVRDVRPLFKAAQHKRLSDNRPHRLRAVGGGHPFSLPFEEQLLLTVMWLRLYPTHEVLAFLFGGIDPTTVSRLLRRILPVLAQAGKDSMRMPDPGRKHRRHFDELLSDLPEFAVVIDSFEQRVQRQRPQGSDPTNRKGTDEANSCYSGKLANNLPRMGEQPIPSYCAYYLVVTGH